MTNLPIPTEIAKAIALDWLRYSLGQGEVISPAALKFIAEREGHGYALVPETVNPARLANPDDGAVITHERAHQGRPLDECSLRSPSTVRLAWWSRTV